MIKLPAYLTGFATKVDGSASVRFSTQELSDNDVLELKRHQGSYGWLLFKENEFTVDDLPKERAEDTSKTPSKRLRATIYVKWQQEGSKGDFEAFYRSYMERIINRIKEMLE